ncbi:Helix-turn-helix [Prevotella sp. KH2C16]|nr:Helix-turn-helix [Prevotella sp. KH2C16]
MKSQHMTQQTFANFLGIAPATLSSIFNGRTKPTLNIVEAVKSKLPGVSTDWLMFGAGSMYQGEENSSSGENPAGGASPLEPVLDFGVSSATPSMDSGQKNIPKEIVKIVDKPQRKITEIRIFFDDQTWESFVPKK